MAVAVSSSRLFNGAKPICPRPPSVPCGRENTDAPVGQLDEADVFHMVGAFQERAQRLEIRAPVKAHALVGCVTTGQFYGEFDTADNQFTTDRSYTGILQFGEGRRAQVGSPDAVGLPCKEHGLSGFCVACLDAPGDKGSAV